MSTAGYLELLHRHLDAPKQRFVEAIASDLTIRHAMRQWELHRGWTGVNGPLFCRVFKRISEAMGEAYGFSPGWLGEPKVPLGQTSLASYDGELDLVYLSPSVLHAPLPLLAAVITHEQVHAFHFWALRRVWRGEPLSVELTTLARFWENEFRRSSAGADYSTLGTEYHAFDLEQALLDRLTPLSNRWRPENASTLQEFASGLTELSRLGASRPQRQGRAQA